MDRVADSRLCPAPRTRVAGVLAGLAILGSCRSAPPPEESSAA